MTVIESNFSAWITDEFGLIVPGSIRKGHNVFTDFGRQWLRELVIWSIIGDLDTVDDAPYNERRFRWIGVGTGVQYELRSVESLVSPLSVTTGPTTYLRVLPAPTFPTFNSIKYTVAFTGASADFDHHGASVTVSEAGIFVDIDDGGGPGLDPTDSDNIPVAYKTFDALTKAAAQTLTITWEFKF